MATETLAPPTAAPQAAAALAIAQAQRQPAQNFVPAEKAAALALRKGFFTPPNECSMHGDGTVFERNHPSQSLNHFRLCL